MGHWSPAIAAGELDPYTEEPLPGGVAAKTRQTLENLKSILAPAACTVADVVSVNVYLVDAVDFPTMNHVCSEHSPENLPAHTRVAVAQIGAGSWVETTCAAAKPG